MCAQDPCGHWYCGHCEALKVLVTCEIIEMYFRGSNTLMLNIDRVFGAPKVGGSIWEGQCSPNLSPSK